MVKEFLTFRGIDQCLIILFMIFSLAVIAGLIITGREEMEREARRLIWRVIVKLETWEAAVLRDDEPFDASWMEYKKWKETRP